MTVFNNQERNYMYQINDKGSWIDLKAKIRHAYPNITEADLATNDGEEIELLARLQKKFSKTKDEIIMMIDKL
jgi:hypothetical protein